MHHGFPLKTAAKVPGDVAICQGKTRWVKSFFKGNERGVSGMCGTRVPLGQVRKRSAEKIEQFVGVTKRAGASHGKGEERDLTL